jgi:hypothetical protein
MKARATICCTIQLGSISSLRCQKSRKPRLSRLRHAKRCFRGRYGYGIQFSATGRLAEPKLAATSPPAPVGLRRDSLTRYASEGWWSQTGSNRRPHACKARALPAELWPRNQKTNAYRPAFALSGYGAAAFAQLACRAEAGVACEGWWAWEDLNFRPHAYQARALTN